MNSAATAQLNNFSRASLPKLIHTALHTGTSRHVPQPAMVGLDCVPFPRSTLRSTLGRIRGSGRRIRYPADDYTLRTFNTGAACWARAKGACFPTHPHLQRPSKAISGHHRPTEGAIRSEAINGHQRSLEAIRGHQRPSEATRGHQRPSEASAQSSGTPPRTRYRCRPRSVPELAAANMSLSACSCGCREAPIHLGGGPLEPVGA